MIHLNHVNDLLLFEWSIVQQFFNQIHMAQQHSSATVPLKAKGVKGITVKNIINLKNYSLVAITHEIDSTKCNLEASFCYLLDNALVYCDRFSYP